MTQGDSQDWDQLLMEAEAMVSMRPFDIKALCLLHLSHMMAGQHNQAKEVAKTIQILDPFHPWAHTAMAFHSFRDGQFKEGTEHLLRHFEFKRSSSPKTALLKIAGLPKWFGSDPAGKRILFCAEAGLGDQWCQARWIHWLVERGAIVDVLCQKSLESVFLRIPGVGRVVGYDLERKNTAHFSTESRYYLPGQGAHAYLRMGDWEGCARGPYVSACRTHSEKFRSILRQTDKIRVGIRWRGGMESLKDDRQIPSHLLLSLAELENVEIYSFQTDKWGQDARNFPDVVDLSAHLQSWEDTAAALKQMDIVISSDTSVAHASAALGCNTWILVHLGNLGWYWAAPGNRTALYPTATLYRQTRMNDWSDVIANIRSKLRPMRRSDFRDEI